MKQVFIHYSKWEDFINGMWHKVVKGKEDELLQQAISFTGDHNLYGAAMLRVITEWPNTCLHNLTDLSINRRAFIGHAACSLEINCPEYIVRMAWGFLNENQQIFANLAADKAIHQWELNHKNEKHHAQITLRF